MVEPKTKILVVEDELPIRSFLRTTLAAHGFAVVEAGTAREAAGLAASHHPDVLLIDLGLPDRDGVELIRELRTWCRAPILIVSARGREEEKVKGLDAGAGDYLTVVRRPGALRASARRCAASRSPRPAATAATSPAATSPWTSRSIARSSAVATSSSRPSSGSCSPC
jgi:two-component system KDP operon response regulator KdpE